MRFFTKHAAGEPFVEQWFLIAIGDDDKAKGAVSKVIKAGEEVVEVVGRVPASNLASGGLTDGEVRLVSPGNQLAVDRKIILSMAVVLVVVPPAMLMRRGLGGSERTE